MISPKAVLVIFCECLLLLQGNFYSIFFMVGRVDQQEVDQSENEPTIDSLID